MNPLWNEWADCDLIDGEIHVKLFADPLTYEQAKTLYRWLGRAIGVTGGRSRVKYRAPRKRVAKKKRRRTVESKKPKPSGVARPDDLYVGPEWAWVDSWFRGVQGSGREAQAPSSPGSGGDAAARDLGVLDRQL